MLPAFKKIPPLRTKIIESFSGINVTESYKMGELKECENITCDTHPALSSRKSRSFFSSCTGTINGIGNHNGVFYTYYSEDRLYLNYNGSDYEFSSVTNCSDFLKKRRFATLENCIVIIPDNIMFFTDSLTFKTIDIDQSFSFDDTLKKISDEVIKTDLFDISNKKFCGYIYSNRISANSVTYIHAGYYTDFYFIAFDSDIKAGDVITIKADVYSNNATADKAYNEYIVKMKNGISAMVKEVKKVTHSSPVGSIEETTELIFDENTIDTGGYSDVKFTKIHIEKKMPEAVDIVSFNNRVWAVSGNKIYASKLGQPDEWNDFSMDSYGTLPTSSFSASSGSDGDFTAIITHGNFIYAFKEDYIYKVYGDTPDEYAISGMSAPGVSGLPDTLCVCGTNLMYSSYGEICVLRDGYPKVVSKKIGKINPLCAASCRGKYYVLCKKDDGKVLYVYDILSDLWVMETCDKNMDNLCTVGENLYAGCRGDVVSLMSDNVGEKEQNLKWRFRLKFESGFFSPGTSVRGAAGVSLKKNASFTVRCIYDDETISAPCGFCFDETPGGSAVLRFPVKRDLGFCLEFRGVGGFTLKNLKFSYYKSDME